MRRCDDASIFKGTLSGWDGIDSEQGSREQHLSIVSSSQIEIWQSIRLQRGKNAKTSPQEQVPRLIDLLGPVTVLKRAKHDFSSP
jgi:hypothetical protein